MDHNLQEELVKQFTNQVRKLSNQQEKNIKNKVDQIYTQLESFFWLQRSLDLQGNLPPLRGWPVSPDFLLRLHRWITKHKPKVVVETGSGASTLVIADALRQNNQGKLFSFEHHEKYGNQSWQTLVDENLTGWVDLRVGELADWHSDHLNPVDAEKKSRWYPLDFDGIQQIELLVVDGPPGGTCKYARYPAVPALYNRMAAGAEVWMDDANRQDEIDVCKRWAELYSFDLEFIPLEKGFACLKRAKQEVPANTLPVAASVDTNTYSDYQERHLGLDFSLPEDRHTS